MAKLSPTFNIGDRKDITPEHLLLLLERMWVDIANAVNAKPDIVERLVNGQPDDTFLSQGTININTSTNKVEMLTNHTSATTVQWTTLS